jgi:hypothetical protein
VVGSVYSDTVGRDKAPPLEMHPSNPDDCAVS